MAEPLLFCETDRLTLMISPSIGADDGLFDSCSVLLSFSVFSGRNSKCLAKCPVKIGDVSKAGLHCNGQDALAGGAKQGACIFQPYAYQIFRYGAVHCLRKKGREIGRAHMDFLRQNR